MVVFSRYNEGTFLSKRGMPHTEQKLDQSQVKFTITVPPNEYEKHLRRAAERLSSRGMVRGFRPGKAPYDLMKREVGEMAILQEALESIIQESFYQTVKKAGLETIGMPQIAVEKLAPGNEIVYTATVALLPQVRVAELSSISIEKRIKPIHESAVEETMLALRGMQAKETPYDGAATVEDKTVIDMDMTRDGVPLDGGQARDYQVYLSEDHYIPGFNAELIGLKAGDEKQFCLKFPESHYQKNFAGKTVDFRVKVKSVSKRLLPSADDAFAKTLGQKSLAALRDLVKKNLEGEASGKAEEQAEVEILDTLIEKSSFDPIPDILIDAERQKMVFELKRDLERHGVAIEQYLSDIKKTEKELVENFRAQAEKRAKAALLSRKIAKTEGIAASAEDIDAEVALLKERHRDDAASLANLDKEEVRSTIASLIQNRKVLGFLKSRTFTG